MRAFTLIGWILLCLPMWAAGWDRPVVFRSLSGQFTVVRTPANEEKPSSISRADTRGLIDLDPRLLAVSCDQIKGEILRLLGRSDNWRGDIRVILLPDLGIPQPIQIHTARYGDRWRYQAKIPEKAPLNEVVRGLTKLILVEMANRRATKGATEIPYWLLEAMTVHLFGVKDATVILQPETYYYRSGVYHAYDLQAARDFLLDKTALSFTDLSSVPSWEASKRERYRYQACARIFLHELLQLPEGARKLNQMLDRLPDYFNWQTAFFDAFKDHFELPIEVEKWWAVNLANFLSSDLNQPLSLKTSLEKLAALVDPSAFYAQSDSADAYDLETIIREWDVADQRAYLLWMVQRLDVFRIWVHPSVRELANDYSQVISDYLGARNQGANNIKHPLLRFGSGGGVQSSLKKIGQLRQKRADLWASLPKR